MNTDYSKLNEKILELAEKFGENGAFLADRKGKTVLSTVFGKSLMTEEPIKAESRYLMPLCCSSMLALCAFILIDGGKLRLSDKLSKFIPEFEHADKIAIRHLLAGKSGIRDFYFGEIRRNLDKDEEYSSLSDLDRRKKDMELYLRDYSFETVLNSIKGKELEHEPGVSGDFSSSGAAFLREIIERVTGIPVSEFIEKEIFEKLGMSETKIGVCENALPLFALFRNEEYIRYNTENTDFPFFTTTVSDLEKLMLGIFEHRLFSEKLWKAATKFDSDNVGLGFGGLDGFSVFAFDFNEFSSAVFYFDKENDFCWLRATNCGSKYIQNDDSKILFFPKEVRMELSPIFTFPKNIAGQGTFQTEHQQPSCAVEQNIHGGLCGNCQCMPFLQQNTAGTAGDPGAALGDAQPQVGAHFLHILQQGDHRIAGRIDSRRQLLHGRHIRLTHLGDGIGIHLLAASG